MVASQSSSVVTMTTPLGVPSKSPGNSPRVTLAMMSAHHVDLPTPSLPASPTSAPMGIHRSPLCSHSQRVAFMLMSESLVTLRYRLGWSSSPIASRAICSHVTVMRGPAVFLAAPAARCVHRDHLHLLRAWRLL